MCHKIALRDKARGTYEEQPDEFASYQSAVETGTARITGSATFDAFAVWQRVGIFVIQPAVVQVSGDPPKKAKHPIDLNASL